MFDDKTHRSPDTTIAEYPTDMSTINHCKLCDRNLSNRSSYRRHIRLVHKSEPAPDALTCCNMTFLTLDLLKNHMAIHKRNIWCKQCGRAFSRQITLRRHIQTVHEQIRLYNCNYCHKGFASKPQVTKHLASGVCQRSSSANKGLCLYCNYKSEKHVSTHMKTCRGNIRRCATCDLSIFDMKQFSDHLAIHPDNELFECRICGEKFLHTWQYARHKPKHISKDFMCEVCSKSFKTDRERKYHMVFHTDRNFECTMCDKKFYRQTDINKHMFVAHSGIKPYMCDTCSSSFPRMTDLKRHVDSVHSNNRPFKCDICAKAFKRMSTLKNHYVLHGDSKPYKCKLCDKSYSQAYSLKEHTMLHTNPFRCDTCNRLFTRLKRLNEHYKFSNCIPPLIPVSNKKPSDTIVPVVDEDEKQMSMVEYAADHNQTSQIEEKAIPLSDYVEEKQIVFIEYVKVSQTIIFNYII